MLMLAVLLASNSLDTSVHHSDRNFDARLGCAAQQSPKPGPVPFCRLEPERTNQDTVTKFRPHRRAAARAPAMAITPEDERELREQLARLLQEHRDLDAAIEALQLTPGSDLLQVQRLKKRKLYLRDRISFIEDQLTPDIIA